MKLLAKRACLSRKFRSVSHFLRNDKNRGSSRTSLSCSESLRLKFISKRKTCSCHCNLTIATVLGRTIMKLETSPTRNVREWESENQQTMIICMSGVHETQKQLSNQSWTERKFNSNGKQRRNAIMKPHGMSWSEIGWKRLGGCAK